MVGNASTNCVSSVVICPHTGREALAQHLPPTYGESVRPRHCRSWEHQETLECNDPPAVHFLPITNLRPSLNLARDCSHLGSSVSRVLSEPKSSWAALKSASSTSLRHCVRVNVPV